MASTITLNDLVAARDLQIPDAWLEAPEPPRDEVSTEVTDTPDYDALSLPELREVARSRGLRTTRSKAEQIQVLRDAD
jgi:hypothetical protein